MYASTAGIHSVCKDIHARGRRRWKKRYSKWNYHVKCVRRTQFNEIRRRVSEYLVCFVPAAAQWLRFKRNLGCIDRAYIVHETNIWEGGVGTTYSRTWLSRAAHSGEPPAVRQAVFVFVLQSPCMKGGGGLNLFTLWALSLSLSPCVWKLIKCTTHQLAKKQREGKKSDWW